MPGNNDDNPNLPEDADESVEINIYVGSGKQSGAPMVPTSSLAGSPRRQRSGAVSGPCITVVHHYQDGFLGLIIGHVIARILSELSTTNLSFFIFILGLVFIGIDYLSEECPLRIKYNEYQNYMFKHKELYRGFLAGFLLSE